MLNKLSIYVIEIWLNIQVSERLSHKVPNVYLDKIPYK